MFIRKIKRDGFVSYAIVESYRGEQGKPRQRNVAYLGRHSTVEAALRELDEEDRAGKPGKVERAKRRKLLRGLAAEMEEQ
jgi:hypothetical protein